MSMSKGLTPSRSKSATLAIAGVLLAGLAGPFGCKESPSTASKATSDSGVDLESVLAKNPVPPLSEEQVKETQGRLTELLKKYDLPELSDEDKSQPGEAADRLARALMAGRVPSVSMADPTEMASDVISLTSASGLSVRAVGVIEHSLKHGEPSPERISASLEILGLLATSVPSAKSLLMQAALYLPDDQQATRAADLLAIGHPAAREWLQTERGGLNEVRQGQALSRNAALGQLVVLVDDLEHINKVKIPLLEQKIAEQAAEMKRLQEEKSALEKVQAALAAEMEREKQARAAEQGRHNLNRREPGIEIVRLAGYGADRGAETEDIIPESARIVGIGYRAGERIDAIWLVYEKDGKILRTPQRGGNGGSEKRLDIDNDEYISFFGYRGNASKMSHLMVYTNKSATGHLIGRARLEPMVRLKRGLEGRELSDDERAGKRVNVVMVGIRVRADSEVRCVQAVVQMKQK